MIFITVGTQPNGFLRCLQEVEQLIEKYDIREEVIAQIGHTEFRTNKFKIIRFIGENEYIELIGKADVIITHAGSGAIFNSIKLGKKIIAMARLHDFNEMVDNHQMELLRKLSDEGYLIDGSYSLIDAWPKLEGFIPRPNDFKCDILETLNTWISEWVKE